MTIRMNGKEKSSARPSFKVRASCGSYAMLNARPLTKMIHSTPLGNATAGHPCRAA